MPIAREKLPLAAVSMIRPFFTLRFAVEGIAVGLLSCTTTVPAVLPPPTAAVPENVLVAPSTSGPREPVTVSPPDPEMGELMEPPMARFVEPPMLTARGEVPLFSADDPVIVMFELRVSCRTAISVSSATVPESPPNTAVSAALAVLLQIVVKGPAAAVPKAASVVPQVPEPPTVVPPPDQ